MGESETFCSKCLSQEFSVSFDGIGMVLRVAVQMNLKFILSHHVETKVWELYGDFNEEKGRNKLHWLSAFPQTYPDWFNLVW